MLLRLITNGSTGAGNGVPSTVSHGVARRRGGAGLTMEDGFDDSVDEVEVLIEATVTAGQVGTVQFVRLWGWFPQAAGANKWFPLGDGVAADKGKLAAAATTAYQLDETGTDLIRHAERVRGIRECDRLYAQYGTLTNIDRIDVTMTSRGADAGVA